MKIGAFLRYAFLLGIMGWFAVNHSNFASSAPLEAKDRAVESTSKAGGNYLAAAVSMIPIVLLYDALRKRRVDAPG